MCWKFGAQTVEGWLFLKRVTRPLVGSRATPGGKKERKDDSLSSSVLSFFFNCSILGSISLSPSFFVRRRVSVPKLVAGTGFSFSSSAFSRTSEYSSWFVITKDDREKRKLKKKEEEETRDQQNDAGLICNPYPNFRGNWAQTRKRQTSELGNQVEITI